MHKKILGILTGLFLLVPITLLAQGTVDDGDIPEMEPVYISYIEGYTKLMHDEKAVVNMIILENDVLEVKEGRVEISLNGSYIWLDKGTVIEFFAIIEIEEKPIKIWLKNGTIYVKVGYKTVEILAGQKDFLLAGEGFYRIEVGAGNKVQKFNSLRVVDNFDKFVNTREKEINSPLRTVEEIRYSPYRSYDYGWRYYIFCRYGYWLRFYYWYPFYPPIWYYYYHYPYFRNYYFRNYYGRDHRDYRDYQDRHPGSRTTIDKNELRSSQRKQITPNQLSPQRTTASKSSTGTTRGTISRKIYSPSPTKTYTSKTLTRTPTRTSSYIKSRITSRPSRTLFSPLKSRISSSKSPLLPRSVRTARKVGKK